MRRTAFILAGLGLATLAVIIAVPRGQAQTPRDAFNQPWLPNQGPSATPSSRQEIPSYIPRGDAGGLLPMQPAAARQPAGPDPCTDLFITPQVGPWVITIISYSTKVDNAAGMARDMCIYLKEQYKLPSYVFLHGAEAKRKEDERVQNQINRYKEELAKKGLTTDLPIRVPPVRIDTEYAVLVGGYPSMEAARRDLDRLRNLPPPDPNRVKLATIKVSDSKTKKEAEPTAVNPFKTAMVGPNPTAKVQQQGAEKEWDIGLLRRLNADEEFSLLKNRKDVTLAVKLIQLPTLMEQTQGGGSKLFTSPNQANATQVDAAKTSAHKLAELLRMGKFEAYVLHTPYYSLVTVGGYSRQDPNDEQRLIRDRDALADVNKRLDPRLQLLPVAKPMPVPR